MSEDLHPLVSVIIPCYNAELWLKEAIESALHQTHSPIEVVVVDDGSTDGSLEVIRGYDGRITWETGSHRGRCHARNRAFEVSHGEYIQFLDADDLLLPEKIERQVQYLETTGADVVYGDWTYLRMFPDREPEAIDLEVAGEPTGILDALLDGWWILLHAALFRRSVVARNPDFDQRVEGTEDTLFFIQLALTEARIVYQPGSHVLYRRYGPTLTRRTNRLEPGAKLAIEHAVVEVVTASNCAPPETLARLAPRQFYLARRLYDSDPLRYAEMMQRVFELDPSFKPSGSWRFNLVCSIASYRAAERLASYRRRLHRKRRSLFGHMS